MDLNEAQDLAVNLMAEYPSLYWWSFGFDRAKQRCGNCNYRTRKITLSIYYVSMNTEADVRDTILHEIAHAIAGHKAGHGPEWKKVARNIGAKPQRCADASVAMPKAPWKIVCATGHVLGFRHRRSRTTYDYACRLCMTQLRYVPNN